MNSLTDTSFKPRGPTNSNVQPSQDNHGAQTQVLVNQQMQEKERDQQQREQEQKHLQNRLQSKIKPNR